MIAVSGSQLNQGGKHITQKPACSLTSDFQSHYQKICMYLSRYISSIAIYFYLYHHLYLSIWLQPCWSFLMPWAKELYINLVRKINHENSTTSFLHISVADSECFHCFFHTEWDSVLFPSLVIWHSFQKYLLLQHLSHFSLVFSSC